MSNLKTKSQILQFFLLVFVSIIYFLTMPKSIGFGDSGLLAAAATHLEVPNPTGFPSYLLLAHLFTKIPFGTVLWRLEFLSVISALIILILVFKFVKRINGFLPAIFSTLLLAFSYSFWSQTVNVESYMMTNLLIFLMIVLSFEITTLPLVPLMAFLLALGFGTNPIFISVLPAVVLIFWQKPHNLLEKRQLIVISFIVFITVVTAIYSYLPLRAKTHPFLNWGDPQNWENLVHYLTGGGLSVVSSAFVNGFTGSIYWYFDAWLRFFWLLTVGFLGIIWPFLLLGFFSFWKKDKRSFWFWLLLIFVNVSLAGIYTSGNRDNWFITSFIATAVVIGEGAKTIFNKKAISVYLILLVLVPLIVWFPKFYQRKNIAWSKYYLEDLYHNLPHNSILLGGGEMFNSLTVYAHEVEKIRPDVLPIDMTIFYGQEWYRKNLKSQISKLKTSNQNAKITDELEFSRMLEELAEKNFDRPIFVTGYLLRQPVYANSLMPAYVPQQYELKQNGIVYKLILKSSDLKSQISKLPTSNWIIKNLSEDPFFLETNYQKAVEQIKMEHALVYEWRGDRLLEEGKTDEAFSLYTKAAELAPKYFDQNRLQEKIQKANSPKAVPNDR